MRSGVGGRAGGGETPAGPITAVLVPGVVDGIHELSCWAANDCMAAPSAASSTITDVDTHGQLWNATAWKATSALPVPEDYNELRSLSCPVRPTAHSADSSGNSPTTHHRFAHLGGHPLLYHWNGSTWTAVAVPAGLDGDVHGVSYPSAGFCRAVGQRTDEVRPLLLTGTGDGATWTSPTPPAATAGSSPLINNAVSCSSVARCTAVGGPVVNPAASPPQHSRGSGNREAGPRCPSHHAEYNQDRLAGLPVGNRVRGSRQHLFRWPGGVARSGLDRQLRLWAPAMRWRSKVRNGT